MYSLVRDLLTACASTEGTEVEFRFPLPERNFEAVRAQYDAGREPRYAETVVQYTDGTDVRCVDGAW